ncbi:hypothetical protein [Micromonospora sp. NPDC004704]
MSDHTTSTRLIASAAREGLAPLGLRRLDRSRTWYDDRGWWVIHVEFQSSRRAGTYLNIGAMWLWVDKNFWTFDEGDRLYWRNDGSFTYDPPYGGSGWLQFLDFLRVEQFSRDLPSLVQIAARRVTELRAQFPDPGSVVTHLASRRTRRAESEWWHDYNTGAAAGLCRDTATARRSFDSIRPDHLEVDWVHDLARTASELGDLASDPDALQERILATIHATRQRLKLPPSVITAPTA